MQVVLVEEAAEILEAHTLAGLPPSVEQFLQIGALLFQLQEIKQRTIPPVFQFGYQFVHRRRGCRCHSDPQFIAVESIRSHSRFIPIAISSHVCIFLDPANQSCTGSCSSSVLHVSNWFCWHGAKVTTCSCGPSQRSTS